LGGTCRHPPCRSGLSVRRRGLCSRCYDRPGIRRLYAAKANGRRGYSDRPADHVAEADGPTRQPPGPGKIPVMRGRAQRGTALFHPNDRSPSLH